jgi:hypothetical protein
MSDVAFVFTNPRHHLEMMRPVATELTRRGVGARLYSLAELRGLDTPRDAAITRVLPFNLRRRARAAARPAVVSNEEPTWRKGRLAQRLVWGVGLAPRMRQLLHRSRVVVIPNDAVFPYCELIASIHRRGVRTVLMQEGIRFPLPAGYDGPQYGGGGTAAVCAWGEGSAEYFVAHGVPRASIQVTGAPRLDDLDPAAWQAQGAALLAEHQLATAPIAFLSNPIEIQGYGAKQLKLDLFRAFLEEAAPVLLPRGIPIIVKNHLHEDPADFAAVAATTALAGLVKVLPAAPIFAAIAACRAAVVLTSTVGLEALTFGKPLGVLAIPGHEFAFEYVQRGAAVPLGAGTIAAGLGQLLDESTSQHAVGQAFVARHLHDRGRARYNVADVIERVLTARSRGA